MKKTTLCFPIKNILFPQVLLGLKKRGFGKDKWAGFGGKVEVDETVEVATVRELAEETALKTSPKNLQKVAELSFLFPHRPTWNQIVYVFLVNNWQGYPLESDEMAPVWFAVDELPFNAMWPDAPYWLPCILNGEKLKAEFVFNADDKTFSKLEIIVL